MRKDNRVRNQIISTATAATLELGLLGLSFIRQNVKYPGKTLIWFAYLTDWKMITHGMDGVGKLLRINQALKISPADVESQGYLGVEPFSPPISLGKNDSYSGSSLMPKSTETAVIEKKLEILRKPGLSVIDLNMVLTVNILYAALDRSGDSLTKVLHTVDLALLIIYAADDTQVVSGPRFKGRWGVDFAAPGGILSTYAVFYGIYQGVFGQGDENGALLYGVLDWENSPAMTAVYSVVLPLLMPVVNGLAIKLVERIQAKLHPEHKVKDYVKENPCAKITKALCTLMSYVMPASLWSKCSTPSTDDSASLGYTSPMLQ